MRPMVRIGLVMIACAIVACPGGQTWAQDTSTPPRICETDLRASRLELDYYARSKAQDLSNAIRVIADQQVVIDRLKAEIDRLKAAVTPKAPAP